ncbi:hypothetical protein AB0G35_04315 [Streptomyces sp. NPDC021749]|uniref:hypothetical protein n=1 Tax=Streptomyces sp. NPDC021749 TaxID=3154905 RepID=UPI0033CDF0FE
MTDSDQTGSDPTASGKPTANPAGNNPHAGIPSVAGSHGPLPPTPPPLPPQVADEGPWTVPANADEALEIGHQLLPELGSPGAPVSLLVHEFDLGYLIQAGWPLPEDPTAPPAEPGGSNIVIAKDTGKVTYIPNYPPQSAMEHYRQLRRRKESGE